MSHEEDERLDTQNEDAEEDRVAENDESRDCKSPTEGTFGDDESKDAEDDGEERPRRRTRRNVRVEEGEDDTEDVVVTRKGSRLNRQSSSEDEVAKSRTRTSSGIKITTSTGRRRISSSEDDVITTKRKTSRINVKERTASIEHGSSGSERTSSAKRSSFSSRRAQTVATPGQVEKKRESFSKARSTSVENESSPRRLSRKDSSDRPGWSSSTKVEHTRVATNTMSRKESTTHSESDEPKSAAQIRAKWENRSRGDEKTGHHKTKAFGGSSGAAALKARFEGGSSNFKRRTSTSGDRHRSVSTDDEDGHRKHSALALKARFEAKNTESAATTAAAPVKRNFVINKNRTSSAVKKFNVGAPTSNKCDVCSKSVYPMEKLEANGVMYHKFCFKCKTCHRTVGLGNYAALEGQIYCKPHLKQLFKLKGNYDEGFGREQRKANWLRKDSNAVSSNPDASNSAEEQTVNGHTEEGEKEEEEVVNDHHSSELVVNEADD